MADNMWGGRYGRTMMTRTWHTGAVHRRHHFVSKLDRSDTGIQGAVACVGIVFGVCLIWSVVCLVQGPGDNVCGPAKWPVGGLAMFGFPLICLCYLSGVNKCTEIATASTSRPNFLSFERLRRPFNIVAVVVAFTVAYGLFFALEWPEIRKNELWSVVSCTVKGAAVRPYAACGSSAKWGCNECDSLWGFGRSYPSCISQAARFEMASSNTKVDFGPDRYDLGAARTAAGYCAGGYRCCDEVCDTCEDCTTDEEGNTSCTSCEYPPLSLRRSSGYCCRSSCCRSCSSFCSSSASSCSSCSSSSCSC